MYLRSNVVHPALDVGVSDKVEGKTGAGHSHSQKLISVLLLLGGENLNKMNHTSFLNNVEHTCVFPFPFGSLGAHSMLSATGVPSSWIEFWIDS